MSKLIRHLILSALGVVGLEILALALLVGYRRLKPQPKRIVFPHQARPPVKVGDHELTIYDYGVNVFKSMLRDIDQARQFVLLETYIFRNDDVGNSFRKRLIRQAQRGRRVYIVFDSVGSFSLPARFRKFPRNVHTFEFGPILSLRTLLRRRLLVRDHRKILVTDGKIAYLGGINIGKEYQRRWRDTHLRIAGPMATNVAAEFDFLWDSYHDDGELPLHFSRIRDPHISILANDPIRRSFPIHDCYLQAFERAERSIKIANSYFLPPRTLIDALTAAADRGVEVEVMISEDSDVVLVDWAVRNLFSELLAHGIRIWLYQRTVNHSKTCTIDGRWSTIGSANLDPVSLRGNFEINAFIEDAAFAAEMEAMWEIDLRNCKQLDPVAWATRSWGERAVELLTLPLVPIL